MTGPIGARTNRAVALVTDDFRLYHRLAPFLERHGVPVLGIRPGEAIPAAVRVVLDGPPGDPRAVRVRSDLEATLLAVLAALDERPVGRQGPRHVIIGVDPGRTIGLAVVVDGELYWVREAKSPEAAVERILAWRQGLRPRHWSVHVGDGSPAEGHRVLRLLAELFPEADVHLVPEASSTPGAVSTISRHTDAAALIARRAPA